MIIKKYKNGVTLQELYPGLFFLQFKDQYDMCMSFLRAQETYESPNPKFRNKPFDILDFMEWYSKTYGNGAFTYPINWGGFNVPSTILHNLVIPDHNKYDRFMIDVYLDICAILDPKCAKTPKFYLIGAIDPACMKHEIAHGLYFLNKEYKKEADKLVNALPKKFANSMKKTLKEMGYTSQVFTDEIQAYLSTGLTKNFKVEPIKEDAPFVELYGKYTKDIK